MSFRFFGTPVRATAESFIMAALFGYFGLLFFGTFGGIVAGVGIGIGSLLIHERMHVALGDRFGILCRGIVLLPFGAVSLLESVGRRPRETFMIAVVGPASSAFLAVGFLIAAALLPASAPSLAQHLAAFGFVLNAGLAIFNALPIYPMDGGRMVHSITWAITHDEWRGKVAAVRSARGTILVLTAAGIAGVAIGYLALFSLLWYGFIAWFLWKAGDAELARS